MKYLLVLLLFSVVIAKSYTQAVSWELSPEPGNQSSNLATSQSTNFDNCVLSRGAGITATSGAGSMNSSAWFSGSSPTTLADAIAGNDYYEFTINTINCIFFNPTTINIVLRSSATGPNTATLRCSSDGFTANIGTVTVTTTSSEFTFSETVSPNSQSVIYRLYGYGTAAGGGTPSIGGTMRVGTSVVASDNDLEVFATSTSVTVTQVTNITVTDGDAVPPTILTANVPGATINWSRTPEDIAEPNLATNGMGNVPAFTADNNSGAPVISTFTVNATVNGCTGSNMVFTIAVDPAPCTITVDFFGNPSACNDNGTPNDPLDDFFTQNVHASFFNRPSTGLLQIVPGGDQIGTYSIPVQNIIGNAHTFNGVQLKADGTPTVIQMNFTDDPSCIDAATGPTVPSCSNGSPPCTITVDFFGNPSACNDNGTPNDPLDDFFTQNVHASFFNRPSTGLLQIVPGGDQIGTYSIPVQNIIGNAHTFNGVQLKADGTPSVVQMNFTDDPLCIDAATGPTVPSCSTGGGTCDITSVNLTNVDSCNDNGTNDPTDDYYTADVVINFVNPPPTGNLQIEPGGDAIGTYSVPVGSLMGNSHTFTNVQFKADGTVTIVEVEFTIPANQCTQTISGPTVQPCSPVCDITSVSFINVQPCNNNETSDPTDDYYTADILVNFVNPPQSGNLQIEPGGDALGTYVIPATSLMGNSHTFTGVNLKADGMLTVVEVEFTIPANLCVQTQTGPTVQPCSFFPPVLTCPAALTVSCASNVPVANPASVGETHDCPGAVIITHIGDVISNQTCANRYTITRTYLATDQCGNTASCSQIITVFDITPPTLTCPVNLTVSCASQVPAASITAVTGVSDACGGTVTLTFLADVISNQTCANRFTITRTYLATDICNNTASCSQTITVFDNTPPTLTCPANLTVSCASLVPAANTSLVTGVSDACGGAVTISVLPDVITNQTCANRFTITRTYRATDVCGNIGACSQIITVFDNAPPSITCPANLTVQCANLVPAVNINNIMVSDNCAGTVSVTHVGDVITNQTCLNRFTLTRTYRATDVCGNSATCAQVITVFDNTPPEITFTDPLLQGVPNGGTIYVQCEGQNPDWELPSFSTGSVSTSDNCNGTVSVTFLETLQDEGNCSVDGYINLYRERWIATDACGNSATAIVYVALVDEVPPVIHGVPADIQVDCDEVPAPPDNIYATDECLCACVILFSESNPAPGCRDGQVIVRTWIARDDCGNETIETQHITLIDEKGPELSITLPEIAGLPDGTILEYICNEGGIPAFYDQLNVGSVYSEPSCGTAGTITFDKDIVLSNNCDFFGYIEQRSYQWIGVDQCGNETTLTIIVQLIDDESPVLTGVPEITCAGDPALAEVEAIDNCGNGNVRYWDVQIPSPCGNGKATRRTYEGFDPCGNTVRDTAIIIPDDNIPPVMTFLDPELAGLGSGEFLTVDCSNMDGVYTSYGIDDVRAEDDCSEGMQIAFKENLIQSSDCLTDGYLAILQLQWTATDICGNSSQLTAAVHIVDQTPPVFVDFNPEITIGCHDPLPSIHAIDNCGGVVVDTAINISQGTCLYEYDLLRFFTATDQCGNTTTQSQIIHVRDGSGPIITGVVEELCDDLSIPVVTAYDPCSGELVEVQMKENEIDVPCRDGKVIERTWTAVNSCGRSTEIHQRIILNDHTPPAILIPTYSVILRFLDNRYNLIRLSESTIIHQLNALNEYSVFVEDECDKAIIPEFSIVTTYADDCVHDGYFERRIYTWIATDICGNSSSVSFVVHIMDDIAPVFIGVPDNTTIICNPLPPVPLVQVDDEAQPVNIIYTESIHPGSGEGVYDVVRHWMATDACGNSSSVVQQITWIPDTHLECDILIPQEVSCNSHGVIIGAVTSGGLGEISYAWEVLGEKCFIQSGQGTPQIEMYIGWSEVQIILTLTDAYGCSTTCSITLDCEDLDPSPFTGTNPGAPLIDNKNLNVVSPSPVISSSAFLKQVNLWPNPANEIINVRFESLINHEVELILFNFMGQPLLQDKIKADRGFTTHQVDISNIPEGGYMMQLQTEGELYTKIIMVIRNE